MPSLTRRQVLAGTSTGLALLAGCSGSETRSREVPRSDATEVDHEFVRARSTSEPTIFRTRDQSNAQEGNRRQRIGREFLATDRALEDVEFASTTAGDRLHSFVTATDFETESVFLYSTGVSECHEIHLQAATVDTSDGKPHLDFCKSVRPADVSCSSEVIHTVGYAVRFPIDGRDVTGSGSGMSTHCEEPPRPSTFDATLTVEEEGE